VWIKYQQGVDRSKGQPTRDENNAPPEKRTPSALTLSELMMASCPEKLCTNVPFGHAHFLMLFPPAEPVAKLYSVGWIASDRTLLWWCVKVVIVLPAARSHSRTVESMLPVMTCGSLSWHWTVEMVPVCPVRTCTCDFVRMSQTCLKVNWSESVPEDSKGRLVEQGTHASGGISTGGDEDIERRVETGWNEIRQHRDSESVESTT
jgi:hypothetical protein